MKLDTQRGCGLVSLDALLARRFAGREPETGAPELATH